MIQTLPKILENYKLREMTLRIARGVNLAVRLWSLKNKCNLLSRVSGD